VGIIANAAVIIIGGIIGSVLKARSARSSTAGIFGICVMLISLVGVIENLFSVSGGALVSRHLYEVVIILAIGAYIGERLSLDTRLSALSSSDKPYLNGFIDASVFFGVGGLQISGPILLAISGDSSQLFLKSAIDLPFAIMFSSVYGVGVILSALPVAAIQVLIAVLAGSLAKYVSPDMVSQLSAMGYVILFFSGFNMICDGKHKIKNTNMVPAILLVIIYNVIVGLMGAS